ncbi:MAG: flagellar basal body-associated FliL family protein [Clostridium sp.]|nr:flagellar basal body-associated FliL family protein [Clostridium sp.]
MAEEKKKSNLKFIIITIAALIVIGIAVFLGVYFTMSKNAEPKEVVIVEEYAELGEILVNLSDEGGRKYLSVSVALSYDSANTELIEEITTKNIALKDSTIFYLKSLKSTDFSAENELNLKQNLVERINSNLTKGSIIDVKITDILVQ